MRQLAVFITLALCLFAAGQASALNGRVVDDGAQIYELPDLDAPVIAVVRGGTKLTISKGTRGDYAKFHKTRVQGKVGWISALDVEPGGKGTGKKGAGRAKAKAPAKGPFAEENEAEKRAEKQADESSDSSRERESTPLYFSRSVGLAIGMTDYKEDIAGSERVANLLTYGLKMTGPDVFFDGPIIDANVLFHYGAPDYYNRLSATKPNGFVMWLDANLLLPFYMRDNALIAAGLGPLLVLSNIQATQGSVPYNMWNCNVGATLELTGGLRIGRVIVRLEAKYLFEKKTYRQAQLALQTTF